MTIDFHTHIYPDQIAAKTVAKLADTAHIAAYTDGTLDALRASMKRAGVDRSVVLPVMTKPTQFQTVNTYAASITGKDGVISFGGMHPDSTDAEAELDTIVSLGLKGIKLHPDYQRHFIDDPQNTAIIAGAIERGLLVTVHAGVDIGLPEPVHCTPQRVTALLKNLPETDTPRLILAHTGGWRMWDEAEALLCGKNVLFDISFSLGMIDEEQLCRIIRRHGADKCLFATDSPWGGQAEMLAQFEALPLSDEEKELIRGENAVKLLGL